MNEKRDVFEFKSFGSLFTLPIPFAPLFFGLSNMEDCSGKENNGQCDNLGNCSPSINDDSCQNMVSCEESINKNDCGNVTGCDYSSNLDGCSNSVCQGSQNNGDGDWLMCEGGTGVPGLRFRLPVV